MLQTIEKEINSVVHTLEGAIQELEDALDTDDIENKTKWTISAIRLVQIAKDRLKGE